MRILPAILIAVAYTGFIAVVAYAFSGPVEVCAFELDTQYFNGSELSTVTIRIREFENGSLTAEFVNPFE